MNPLKGNFVIEERKNNIPLIIILLFALSIFSPFLMKYITGSFNPIIWTKFFMKHWIWYIALNVIPGILILIYLFRR